MVFQVSLRSLLVRASRNLFISLCVWGDWPSFLTSLTITWALNRPGLTMVIELHLLNLKFYLNWRRYWPVRLVYLSSGSITGREGYKNNLQKKLPMSYSDGTWVKQALLWPGSRAHLRALEALEFLMLSHIFSCFLEHVNQSLMCNSYLIYINFVSFAVLCIFLHF